MDAVLRRLIRETPGFMDPAEGLALHDEALRAGRVGPLLEIGSYCGLSALYLGAAARRLETTLYSVDHHRGSEEHQPGEGYHDESLMNAATGRVDTLPHFVRTIERAGLAPHVRGIAAVSAELATVWRQPLGLVFIDGGHSTEAAHADLEGWAPHLAAGGSLCIHDVFPDPAQGGRPPFEIYLRALASGRFTEVPGVGSLRILRKAQSS